MVTIDQDSTQALIRLIHMVDLPSIRVSERTAGGRGMLAMLTISSRNSGHFFMMAAWSLRSVLGMSARARCASISMWHFMMEGLRFQNCAQMLVLHRVHTLGFRDPVGICNVT